MWKKLFYTFICFSVLYLFPFENSNAYDTIVDIIINDVYVDFDSSYAFIKDNKTYIPLRKISEILGYNITWNNNTKSAIIKNSVSFTIGNSICTINEKQHILSSEPILKNNTLFVPARDFFNIFNIAFKWDDMYYSIIIENENIYVSSDKINYNYSYDHIYWLSRIISAESRGEPLKGQIAVGNVVLNRVKSPHFPNTIYNVIFDTKYAVQYEPTINGTIYNKPVSSSVIAAKLSLNNFNVIKNCTYFFNPKISTSTWIKENKTYYKSIGNHDFYFW